MDSQTLFANLTRLSETPEFERNIVYTSKWEISGAIKEWDKVITSIKSSDNTLKEGLIETLAYFVEKIENDPNSNNRWKDFIIIDPQMLKRIVRRHPDLAKKEEIPKVAKVSIEKPEEKVQEERIRKEAEEKQRKEEERIRKEAEKEEKKQKLQDLKYMFAYQTLATRLHEKKPDSDLGKTEFIEKSTEKEEKLQSEIEQIQQE